MQKTDTCSYFSFMNIYFTNFVVCSVFEFFLGCFHETVEVLKFIIIMLSAV